MNKKLQSIAKQLTENDIQELIRMRKESSQKAITLRKKRDKLAAELARLDAQLEKLEGGDAGAGETKPARGRRSRKKTAAAKAPAKPKKAGARKGKSRRVNLSAAVREVFAQAGAPLKASQVVDGLPAAGVKVKDVAEMRKRISVVLASQKTHFEQVERGVYQLKTE